MVNKHKNLKLNVNEYIAFLKGRNNDTNAIILLKYVNMLYYYIISSMHAQSCLTLCDSMDCSPPGSSVWDFLRWVAISYSRDLPNPGIEPVSPVALALSGRLFTTEAPGEPHIL